MTSRCIQESTTNKKKFTKDLSPFFISQIDSDSEAPKRAPTPDSLQSGSRACGTLPDVLLLICLYCLTDLCARRLVQSRAGPANYTKLTLSKPNKPWTKFIPIFFSRFTDTITKLLFLRQRNFILFSTVH